LLNADNQSLHSAAFAAEWANGTICESIFVEYDAIDHHGITFTGKLYMHRDTNLDSCPTTSGSSTVPLLVT